MADRTGRPLDQALSRQNAAGDVEMRLACRAMASRFELVLFGKDEARLRAAGEEALAEIQRLDARLSRFQPTSDISRINREAFAGPVRAEARLFSLLVECRRIWSETGGAFDITVGPLMQAWGFVHNTGRLPDEATLAKARSASGMHLVDLDESERTIRFAHPDLSIDLGAIGKGYAVDEAMQLLRDAGVENAFLHGGTSTIYGLGTAPGGEPWHVAIPAAGTVHGGDENVEAVIPLQDEALSVSAVWGKAFEADGHVFGHVIDPRSGRPVRGATMAAVTSTSATAADALSTSLLVLGSEGLAGSTSDRGEGAFVVLDEGSYAAGKLAHLCADRAA